jgi:hypothetical protein
MLICNINLQKSQGTILNYFTTNWQMEKFSFFYIIVQPNGKTAVLYSRMHSEKYNTAKYFWCLKCNK